MTKKKPASEPVEPVASETPTAEPALPHTCPWCHAAVALLTTVHEWVGRVKETYRLCATCAVSRSTLWQPVVRQPNRAMRRETLIAYARMRRHAVRWLLSEHASPADQARGWAVLRMA